MTYLPAARGAKCAICPVGPNGWLREDAFCPVPGEVHKTGKELRASIAALAACPADTEVQVGRPLVGESGIELNRSLAEIGHSRREVDLFNVIDCRPPGPASGGFERLVKSVERRRKARTKTLLAGDPSLKAAKASAIAAAEFPHAWECCRPRLAADIAPYRNLIALGKEAYYAITGKTDAVRSVRGGPIVLPVTDSRPVEVKLLPTYHPSAVLRSPSWRDVMRKDLGKAWRHFEDRLQWVDPVREVIRSPAQLESWLRSPSPFWTVDTETDGLIAMQVAVEMLQIATPDLDANGRVVLDQYAAVQNCRTIAILFVDEDGTSFWEKNDLNAIRDILVPFLEDETILKLGTNIGYYDTLALKKTKWRRTAYITANVRGIGDKLFAARFVAPDLPKGLKTQGSIYTDVGRWENNEKGEKNATGRNTPERTAYGQTDVAVDARTAKPLLDGAEAAGAFVDIGIWTDDAAWLDGEVGRWIGSSNSEGPGAQPTDWMAGIDLGTPTAPAKDPDSRQPTWTSLEPPSWPAVSERWSPTWREDDTIRPFNLWEVDHFRQAMCVKMHEAGIYIDQDERLRLERQFRASVAKRRKNLEKLAADVGVNPANLDDLLKEEPDKEEAAEADADADETGSDASASDLVSASLSGSRFNSYDTVRELLYETWALGIPPFMEAREFYTMTGLPSTGDKVLRAHLAGGRLTKAQFAFLMELRLARREANKILGTTLIPMRPRSMDPKKGLVWEDGRIRSTWNAHVTAVGRLSSSQPNCQNVGSRKGQGVLQSLFAAPAGRHLWGFDLEQAHLRIVANYWKIPRLIECFGEGVDAHNLLARDVEGQRFLDADGGPKWNALDDNAKMRCKPGKLPNGKASPALSIREFFKTLRYLLIYAGQEETAWLSLTSTETDDGKLRYLRTTLAEVTRIRRTWLKVEPEWAAAWEWMEELYARNAERAGSDIGYMVGPVSGRRSGPLSGGKTQEVVNWPVLETESMIMALAEMAVIERFPWGIHGENSGAIAQIHDALKLELADVGRGLTDSAAEAAYEKISREIGEAATIRIPGWDIAFPVEVHHGRHFGQL